MMIATDITVQILSVGMSSCLPIIIPNMPLHEHKTHRKYCPIDIFISQLTVEHTQDHTREDDGQ